MGDVVLVKEADSKLARTGYYVVHRLYGYSIV